MYLTHLLRPQNVLAVLVLFGVDLAARETFLQYRNRVRPILTVSPSTPPAELQDQKHDEEQPQGSKQKRKNPPERESGVRTRTEELEHVSSLLGFVIRTASTGT